MAIDNTNSQRISTIMYELSDRAKDYIQRTEQFIKDEIEPVEADFWHEVHRLNVDGDWTKWQWPAMLETLKAKAKAAGLWNMFLPDATLGAGLSVQEYAHIAERTGRSLIAPTVFNCNAPDTGNMEVLWRYGSEAQQEQWFKPLLAGEIRSVFCMTEPDVASSDATNMQATAVIEGDEIVLNGRKWWSSGLGDPNAKVIIFMAHTPDESKDRHHQHSMVLVPVNTQGVTIERMLPVFGDYDAPHGHGEVSFDNVRVPVANFIGGAGQGFEIAQGRLGPGRIHHCMRAIGAGEVAIELMCKRGMDPNKVAFGKNLAQLGANFDYIAESRIELNAARFLTLDAAVKMDTVGNKIAASEIAQIKVYAPNVALKIIDRAIQIHGGEGVSQLTPLASMYAHMRTLRLADGPDEVHRRAVARYELGKYMS